jgi:hypothetical protein
MIYLLIYMCIGYVYAIVRMSFGPKPKYPMDNRLDEIRRSQYAIKFAVMSISWFPLLYLLFQRVLLNTLVVYLKGKTSLKYLNRVFKQSFALVFNSFNISVLYYINLIYPLDSARGITGRDLSLQLAFVTFMISPNVNFEVSEIVDIMSFDIKMTSFGDQLIKMRIYKYPPSDQIRRKEISFRKFLLPRVLFSLRRPP